MSHPPNRTLSSRATIDAAPTAITPGLTYATYAVDSFQPLHPPDGPIEPQQLVAHLRLPVGAVLNEVQFTGHNSSSTSQAVDIVRATLDSGQDHERVWRLDVPPSGSALVTATGTLDHVVAADSVYLALTAAASTGFRVLGLRVGYAGSFGVVPVDPHVRLLDTRAPGGLSGPFRAGQTRTLTLAPVPPDASAALLSLTVTNTTGDGFVRLLAAGATPPVTSDINWSGSRRLRANVVMVAMSATRAIDIVCGGPGNPRADVIVDLLGYYP